MIVHIGSAKTKKTRCKKPIARRWWVRANHVEHKNYMGVLNVYEYVRSEKGANCKDCLKNRKRNR